MGQLPSGPARSRSPAALTHELALIFADKCFTSLELFSLRANFRSLADRDAAVPCLQAVSVATFLELPGALATSPVVVQMLPFLAAFPFLDDGPAPLGFEQLVIAVAILTNRYHRALPHRSANRTALLFRSLAVYDHRSCEHDPSVPAAGLDETKDPESMPGGAARAVQDPLVFAALDLISATDMSPQDTASTVLSTCLIPCDNFRHLIQLLLLTAPLHPQESLSLHPDRVAGTELATLRSAADCVLAAFVNVEQSPGISFRRFAAVLSSSMPFFFHGLTPLFEHLLFSETLDLSRHKSHDSAAATPPLSTDLQRNLAVSVPAAPGQILNPALQCQLSFFIPGASLFGRLTPLYSGAKDGFSVGRFEATVFHWQDPTILLVRGTRLPDVPRDSQAANFTACVSGRRLQHTSSGSSSSSREDRLVFGAYLSQPWRHTHKDCFGGADTLLFQLEPVHDLFRASPAAHDFASFTRAPAHQPPFLAFGSPHPLPTQTRRAAPAAAATHLTLGPVSLLLDASFAFGVFTHDPATAPAAFLPGSAIRPCAAFQDRFSVDSLEVWGCARNDRPVVRPARVPADAHEAELPRRTSLRSYPSASPLL